LISEERIGGSEEAVTPVHRKRVQGMAAGRDRGKQERYVKFCNRRDTNIPVDCGRQTFELAAGEIQISQPADIGTPVGDDENAFPVFAEQRRVVVSIGLLGSPG
jgi:hypothetical protein